MSVAAPRSIAPALAATPCLRLTRELLLFDRDEGLGGKHDEACLPVLELSFDYDGIRVGRGRRLRTPLARDLASERNARFTLESFGVLEIECIEGCEPPLTSRAEYLIDAQADVDALCTFSAYALPQLRALGWQIEIADDYPLDIVEADQPWFARVGPDPEKPDWFSLELGLDIDGERVNLLPALVDMIETAGGGSLRDLFAGRRRFVGLPLGGSRYLPVPRERLETLLRVLLEMYDGERGAGLSIPASRLAAIDTLCELFPEDGLSVSGCEDTLSRGRALSTSSPVATIEPPAQLRATLRPYQLEGVSWLQHLRAHDAGGILADDMGLGKTLQTIAHISCEKAAGRNDRPTLIVAPTSLVENWRRELRRFAPHITVLVVHGPDRAALFEQIPVHDVVVTSYPILTRDLEAFTEYDYHLCILDEAQTIKNGKSRAHRSVSALEARHRLCLTGTPVENNLGELHALFAFLDPELLGDSASFRRRFQIPIERDPDGDRMDVLRARLAPYILRRDKATVAKELPPKTELVRPVDLSGAQRDLYESIRVAAHARVRKAIHQRGLAASTITILDALTKLRQVCCDPRLVSSAAAAAVNGSAKYQLLFDILDRQLAQGRRILIFSQFTSMLGLIGEGLSARQLDYACLTGATTRRQELCDRFERGEVDVFLISLKAGGTGLNLVSADTVIHYDPWWNPAAQAQATDRAYRIGQTKPVFVTNLIVAGSVEERMLGLQRHKRQLADRILGVGDERATFSEGDIDDLFAPLGN